MRDLHPLSVVSTTDAMPSLSLNHPVEAQTNLNYTSPTNKSYLQTSKAEGRRTKF